MDKIERLLSAKAITELGQVLLRSSAPWLNEFIRELSSFPLDQSMMIRSIGE
jgi:phage terminase large subunit-like protein